MRVDRFSLTRAATAPPATADSATRSQWLTRDAAPRLAIRNYLPLAECAHFGQHRTAQALYDAVVTRYSSSATAALGRLLLPYLFPELSAFATVEDLVSHLRTSDARYRATIPAEFLERNHPPMFITLYFIVTRLPDSLRSVRDHFLSLDPTSLTVDLLEQHLLAAESSAVAVGAARGTPRPPFFEGCSPSPLAPSYACAAAVADVSVAEDVGATSASAKRRSSKGKGGRGGGGGSGGGQGGSGSGGGGSSGGSGGSGGGGGGGTGGGSGGSGGGGGGSGGSGAVEAVRLEAVGQDLGMEALVVASGSSSSIGARPSHPSSSVSGCFSVGRLGTCGKIHTQHRCFSRLDDAWRAEFGDDVELPRWADLLRSRIAIFDLDIDAILSAMYSLSVSAEGDCYRCVPPDPGIAAAALGASESGTLPGTTPAQALHTFTLDPGTSRCLFRDSTTLTPLPAPLPVRLADPFGGPVVARSSTVLPCSAYRCPPGWDGHYHHSWGSACVDLHVHTNGRHLATFTRQPGSSLYTLATEPPQVAASAQVSASGQVAASCSCRLLSHQTLLWHHRLGHPSLPRLRGMHSRLLVSGLPRSLPPLPPSPTPPCLPCVEGRQCAAPHSSSFPPTTTPLQTLHLDVRGPASVSGQGREHYFLLVVDDYTRYTTVFPLRSKGELVDVLIPWIRTVRLQLREQFGQDLAVLRLHSRRGVSLADPSGGPVLAHSSTVLPCPAAPSGLLSGLHLPSFSTNLVSGADLQDAWVDQFTPGGQRVTHDSTFPRRRQVAASSQVFAAASRSSPASAPCSCRPLSHETLLWHHRLGHPSLPRRRGMASRTLVTSVTPQSSPCAARVTSLRGGEFCSDLLRAFCCAEGIRQTFTLPASPQQNGIAERRIGMVMDVARTSMIHAAAPHFLWPFAVQYAAHQINLQPRVSLPETTPTLRWTGKVGDASVFRVWGSRAFVRDTSADKLSYRARVEPGGTASGGAEPARAESRGSPGVPWRREPQSPQQLRKWYAWRCRGATGAAGAGGTAGAAGGAAGATRGATGAGPTGGAAGAGAAGAAGGTSRAAGGAAGAGAAGAAGGTGAVGGPSGSSWRSSRSSWRSSRSSWRSWSSWTTLAALGFAPSTADPSLFLRTDATLLPFYILVYVDNLIFATADTEALTHVNSKLQKRHTCIDLGLSVLRLNVLLFQSTPLPTGHSLSAPPSDESVESSGPYPELVGCLMYLMTCTRPDLAYPLSLLARYVAPGRHRKVRWDAAKRLLRYLCSTSSMGLVLGERARIVLTGHADASWVDDLATQRSSQGYTFSLGSGSVSWWSTCSSSVLSSSCEAEIYAGAMATQELRWLNYLLTDLGEAPCSPPVLYVDNKAMLALCQEHRLEHRTKHIALRYCLARELQQRGQLCLAYVASQASTADVFTKALQPCDHQRFSTVLGEDCIPVVPEQQLHVLTSSCSTERVQPVVHQLGRIEDTSVPGSHLESEC
ncbi:unnamed protein product [Closterium sp. NIES-54]